MCLGQYVSPIKETVQATALYLCLSCQDLRPWSVAYRAPIEGATSPQSVFHKDLCQVECLGHSVLITKVFVKRRVFTTVNYTLGSPVGEVTLSQCVPH